MLRVMITAAVLITLGGVGVGWRVEEVGSHGESAGWSGWSMELLLPVIKGGATLCWTSLVGAWAFWCRVVLLADGDRAVRRAAGRALRVWRCRPLQSVLFFVVLTWIAAIGGGAHLLWWRQSPPATAGAALIWHASWVALILIQAALWHWLLRAARLLYAELDLPRPTVRKAGGEAAPLRRLRSLVRRSGP
jgi:hypothetical protein